LRGAAGTAALAQGIAYFATSEHATLAAFAIGLVIVVGGAALLVGFLTPLASTVVALICLGLTVGWIDPPARNLLDSRFAALLVATIALAAACLGPGAFSIDARLFGRRELLIRP
jgi:uncharacterized membrane protein YphA (DoxX/SURF4 family)